MGVRRKVLIVSLTRLGDLIQEGPLIRILRRELHPVEIHVITSRGFVETVKYIPPVDKAIEINYEDIIRLPLLESYKTLKSKLEDIREEGYYMVINLTPSFKERYMSYFVGGKKVVGPSIKDDGSLFNTNPWTDYLYAVIIDKTFNDFNLCDLFIKIAGFEPEGKPVEFNVKDEDRKEAGELLKPLKRKGPLIAFQLGASTKDRMWPPENFGILGRNLQDYMNADIVLLGVEKERYLGERASRFLRKEKMLNLIGKTRLGTLGAVLEEADLLVTNDTGTMHVAAGVGTKTVAMFLSSARFRDTGPYAQDHIAIQPDIECSPCSVKTNCKNLRCHRVITPEAVFYIVKSAIEGAPIKPSPVLSGTQVYRSTFDDEGYLRFFPAFKRSISRMELILLTSRRVWRAMLDRKLLEENFFESEARKVIEEIKNFYAPSPLPWEDLIEPLEELEAEVGRLEGISEDLFKAEISSDRRALNEAGERFLKVVDKLQEKSVRERFLQPFFIIFHFSLENMGTSNPAPNLWRKSYELKTLIQAQKRLLNKTKKLWEGYNGYPSAFGRQEIRA